MLLTRLPPTLEVLI